MGIWYLKYVSWNVVAVKISSKKLNVVGRAIFSAKLRISVQILTILKFLQNQFGQTRKIFYSLSRIRRRNSFRENRTFWPPFSVRIFTSKGSVTRFWTEHPDTANYTPLCPSRRADYQNIFICQFRCSVRAETAKRLAQFIFETVTFEFDVSLLRFYIFF